MRGPAFAAARPDTRTSASNGAADTETADAASAPAGAQNPQPAGPATEGPGGDSGLAPVATHDDPARGVWSLLPQARLLQVIVVVVIAANLAGGGTFEVALPALAGRTR